MLDESFAFATLLPIIDEPHALNKQTHLNFTHHTLAGSWEELTHNGADIIPGTINEPPTLSAWSYKMPGTLDNVFVVAPGHPLAPAPNGLTNESCACIGHCYQRQRPLLPSATNPSDGGAVAAPHG